MVIASRPSPLARRQTQAVGRWLAQRHGIDIDYAWITSNGDRVSDRPLASVGGKGLFTKAVDDAVLTGRADLAVHSLKDVPTTLTPGLQIAATPKRGPVGDVLITQPSLRGIECPSQLPEGAVVGTSSPRRAAQLRTLHPSLNVRLLRGNVGTRLAALRGPDAAFHATLLAAAGLQRLGVTDHGGAVLNADTMLPPAAQGALALVCRADDHVTLTRSLPLNDAATSTAVNAERRCVALLDADCHSPVAALCEPVDPKQTVAKRNADSHWFRLRVRVVSLDGQRDLRFDERCKTRELRRLVKQAADTLLEQGAGSILLDARSTPLFSDSA